MFIPNVFTPNGDEHNHNFKPIISGQKIDGDYELIIVNRWGQTIWQSNDYNSSWDGTFNGKPLNSAVFVYSAQVTYIDGREQTQQGNITLIR